MPDHAACDYSPPTDYCPAEAEVWLGELDDQEPIIEYDRRGRGIGLSHSHHPLIRTGIPLTSITTSEAASAIRVFARPRASRYQRPSAVGGCTPRPTSFVTMIVVPSLSRAASRSASASVQTAVSAATSPPSTHTSRSAFALRTDRKSTRMTGVEGASTASPATRGASSVIDLVGRERRASPTLRDSLAPRRS